MKRSFIIATYFSERTVGECLDAVFKAASAGDEVIVVDDASRDRTLEVCGRYPCRVVALPSNHGQPHAMNVGSRTAGGDVLIFVDSDSIVRRDASEHIEREFHDEPGAVAVTGMLSKRSGLGRFFTAYKNLYMNYTFMKMPRLVSFLYGGIMAIKKDEFIGFDEKCRFTSDTELGLRYAAQGRPIVLSRRLEVTHLKEYTYKSIVMNDFRVPFWWARSFVAHDGIGSFFKKKKFAHASVRQLVSIAVAYLLVAGTAMSPMMWWWPLAGVLLFVALNFEYWRFVFKDRGWWYAIRAALFNYADHLVMGAGIVCGLFYWGCLKRPSPPAAI